MTETVDPEGSPLNPDMLCVIMIQVCTFILSSVFHIVSTVAPSYCYPAGDLVLSFPIKETVQGIRNRSSAVRMIYPASCKHIHSYVCSVENILCTSGEKSSTGRKKKRPRYGECAHPKYFHFR